MSTPTNDKVQVLIGAGAPPSGDLVKGGIALAFTGATFTDIYTSSDGVNVTKLELTSIDTDKLAGKDYTYFATATDLNNINTLLTSDDTTLDELQEIVDYIKQNKTTLSTLAIANIAGLQTALDNKVSIDNVQALANGEALSIDGSTITLRKGDNTSDVIEVPVGTNVTLTDSVTTTDSNVGASATAVKTAYDKGNHPHPYAGTNGDENEIFRVGLAIDNHDALPKGQLLQLGITRHVSGTNDTTIQSNEILLRSQIGEDDELKMLFNLWDNGGKFEIVPSVGGSGKTPIHYDPGTDKWLLDGLELTNHKSFSIYYSDDNDSKVTDENIYGDTAVSLGRVEIKGVLIGDVIHIQYYLNLAAFSVTLPSDSTFAFKFDLLTTLKSAVNISSFQSGTTYGICQLDFGDKTKNLARTYTTSDGLLQFYQNDSTDVKDNGNSFTATGVSVFGAMMVRINK